MSIYSSYHTDDPVADQISYQYDLEQRLRRYPRCECCEEPIINDYFYEVEGRRYCSKACRNRAYTNELLDRLIKGTGYDDDFSELLDEFTDIVRAEDIA